MAQVVGLRQREKHFLRHEKIHGQFLTPYKVAEFTVRFALLNTDGRFLGIDPACGDGMFLKALVEAGIDGIEENVGVDIDPRILNGLPLELTGRVKTLVADALQPLPFTESSADIAVGNPPFSAKYGRVSDAATLQGFELGRGRKSQAIEILFLERFLQLASPLGVVGMILPHGVFSVLPLRYVRTFVTQAATVLGVVSLPRRIFANGTTSKTCILFLQKRRHQTKTFMGIARHLDDLPLLLKAYAEHQEAESPPAFWVDLHPDSFDPELYWLSRANRLSFKPGLRVQALGELLTEMRCGGTEYGEKREFALQGIPFISAKTVTPLGVDLSRSQKHVAPNSAMDKRRAYVEPGDVVFVRVGVGCSGRVAVVPDGLEKGIADDWIYIMRTQKISPYYLALFLQSELGRCQVNPLKRGVGTVTIPQRLLKNVLVPIPPVSFQEAVEAGYKEMVRLRQDDRLANATEKLRSLLCDIETMVGMA